MPSEDYRRAMRHMTSKHLEEVAMEGEGDCLFIAVKSAVRGSGLEMSAEQLREGVTVEMQDESTVMRTTQHTPESEIVRITKDAVPKEMQRVHKMEVPRPQALRRLQW